MNFGGLVPKINLQSKSDEFHSFVKQVDNVLSCVQTTTPDGQPLEYKDDHFQDSMKRLQAIHYKFENGPMYPIGVDQACALVWNEIESKQNEMDQNGL